jgi:hypothetical protein
MPTRYSGSVKIFVNYDDRGDYKAFVTSPSGKWHGRIGAPAAGFGPGIAYDSLKAYDGVAHAALSFACDENSDICNDAMHTDSGWHITRKPYKRIASPHKARSPSRPDSLTARANRYLEHRFHETFPYGHPGLTMRDYVRANLRAAMRNMRERDKDPERYDAARGHSSMKGFSPAFGRAHLPKSHLSLADHAKKVFDLVHLHGGFLHSFLSEAHTLQLAALRAGHSLERTARDIYLAARRAGKHAG